MIRILVVEDSATQAEALRLMLESGGFEVAVARNGRAGLTLAQNGPFDLILSDILMPDLSGYELCRQLKTDPQTSQTPVVLLTQLTDPLDILKGLECGADNFITKPVDVNHLLRRIRNILDNRSQRGQGVLQTGTVLYFRGKGVTITTDKEQILDLLLATVEDFVIARMHEREAQVAREKLEKQTEELTESSKRKDQHLAMLAHELRGPMAPLLTSLHLLRQKGGDAAAREQSLDRMERQLGHLGRLIDDLLDASRVVQGKVQLRPVRLDLVRLVRTAVEDRRAVLEQRGLGLVVQTPETPLWVQGDEVRLAQVFSNLLDNAARYTDRGGQVAVRVSPDVARQRAEVAIADTGVGIAPDVLPRLFEPFAQAEQELDRPRGGLGLGLSVVKGLVQLHGGEVHAVSPGLGKGAEIIVRLPLEPEPAALVGASSA